LEGNSFIFLLQSNFCYLCITTTAMAQLIIVIVNASASPQLIILMPSEYSKLHHIVGSEVLALVGY
jgi:hypothetical protein